MLRTEHSSLRQGLVGAWCPSLGASGLSLIDRSGRGNHGTLTNMGGQDNWRASGSGVALSLDGVNDFANVGNPSYLNFGSGTFTFSMWINPTVLSSGQYLFLGKDAIGGRQFVLQGNADSTAGTAGQLALFVLMSGGTYHGQKTSGNPLLANSWQHVVGVRNASALVLYHNGASQSLTAVSGNSTLGAMLNTSTPMYIGARSYSGFENYFGGLIDDVRIYSRALTDAEIRLLASRRGIGLSPLADRGAALPRRFSVNVGGDWRPADAYVNVGGTWKLAEAKINVGGTWK